MSGWKKWLKWNFAVSLLVFASGFVYEWCWDPANWKLYAAFLGGLAALSYPLWRLNRRELENLNGPPSKWLALFQSAVCVVLLIVRCLESKESMQVPHVMLLSWYIGFAIDGLIGFFALWRWENRCKAEYRERMASGGLVWNNINMPKGK